MFFRQKSSKLAKILGPSKTLRKIATSKKTKKLKALFFFNFLKEKQAFSRQKAKRSFLVKSNEQNLRRLWKGFRASIETLEHAIGSAKLQKHLSRTLILINILEHTETI